MGKNKKTISTGYTFAQKGKQELVQKLEDLEIERFVKALKELRNIPLETGRMPSYRDLESMTGISRSEIGYILQGRTSGKTIKKYARAIALFESKGLL